MKGMKIKVEMKKKKKISFNNICGLYQRVGWCLKQRELSTCCKRNSTNYNNIKPGWHACLVKCTSTIELNHDIDTK